MKVSLNTIKSLINFELPPVDELKKRIDEQLGKVESVTDLGAKYASAVIVKVVHAEKHPNADKLTVCKVDDGGVVNDVPRDENGYVQVVCGAPNAREGVFAVWLPPGSTVPASFDDTEPFVLGARELRGVTSQGMLAAADELVIGSDHNGIIELNEDDLPLGLEGRALTPGQDFAELFGLDDTIFDVENKMFTHRPDCFGQLGVAREIAGILGHKFTSPEWYLTTPEFAAANGLELTVTNEAKENVPRFMAVAMKDAVVKPSPFWLQCELVRLGGKPINNIVDITNYVMLMTGQPLHAYDYDKLAGHALGVRMGKQGETLPLLNGKTYEVTPDDIVIVDGEKPIGMGGIMGGGNSEVSDSTKNIVLECATFDMYTIRKTSMRHGLFTDAVTRFNKGQSPLQNDRVLNVAMMSIFDIAGGTQASSVADNFDQNKYIIEPVAIKQGFINDRLGVKVYNADIKDLLSNVEFQLEIQPVSSQKFHMELGPDKSSRTESETEQDNLLISWPFWRTDIEYPEDIVEEVGRLYGFDKLPRVLPQRSIKPVAKNAKREVAHLVRESLSKAGANEVLTYSFVHKNVMERAGQDVSQAFQLSNALSPDLQYYRTSLTPSLLDKIHGNVKAGYDEFALFEIGKGHNKQLYANDDDGLPSEMEFVDLVYTNKKPGNGAPYYHVRRFVTQLTKDLGFTLKFKPITEAMDYPLTAPFDLERSALIESYQGEFIGMVGELKQSVLKNFKLPEYTAAMTLDLQGLANAYKAAGNAYAALSRYPSITQDISLKVPAGTGYEKVFLTSYDAMRQAAGDGCDVELTPLSIYGAENDHETKTVTLRAKMTSYETTLKDSDVEPVMDAAAAAAKNDLGAERI